MSALGIIRPPLKAQAQPAAPPVRLFDFNCDSFSFANELIWEYHFDALSGRTTYSRRQPKPSYAHRCFVLTSAVRQFFFHAVFDPTLPQMADQNYQPLLRSVLSQNPRIPSNPQSRTRFPGYAGLRQFSQDRERLLKAECGGAWRSYVLRSHWRMVFPITRNHQSRTAARLLETIRSKGTAVVHLVCFPSLSINHGMVLYHAKTSEAGLLFDAYDPNLPAAPACLSFDQAAQTFHLSANSYWAGGPLDVIEIYRNWLI